MRARLMLLAFCLTLAASAVLIFQTGVVRSGAAQMEAVQTGATQAGATQTGATQTARGAAPRSLPTPPVTTTPFPRRTPAAGPAVLQAPALPIPAVSLPPVSPLDVSPFHQNVPVQLRQLSLGRSRVALLVGGLPVSRHVLWRSSVGQFVRSAGAVAGVNGTFFKDAAIASNDSNMLGPMLTAGGEFLSETDPAQLKKIGGRPLVAWSHDQFLVTAFDPGTMNRRAAVQAMLPGVTDAFLAGGWLVHGGQALSLEEMMVHAPKDAQEVRPRVFFGVTKGGLSIAGATITPVSSVRLAQIAQEAGAQEAVLMDSGYSTSLIYGSRVLAVGHKTRTVPSRPVPHAIVFMNPVLALVKTIKP